MRKVLSIALALGLCVLPLHGSRRAASGTADVLERAVRADGGQAVRMTVIVACELDPDETILEAHVSASQTDAFGQAGLNVDCDGRDHRYQAVVSSTGGRFERGAASGSAFLLILNTTTQQTTQISDATTMIVR